MKNSAYNWTRKNFFNSPTDALLSLVAIPSILYIFVFLCRWAVSDAHWTVVYDNVRVLMLGTIPHHAEWRAWCATALLCSLFGATLGQFFKVNRPLRWLALFAVGISAASIFAFTGEMTLSGLTSCIIVALAAWTLAALWPAVGHRIGLLWLAGLASACAILMPAGVDNWGGLLLSLLITAIGALFSIPLGVLLAFGRHSQIRSVRISCTFYIETIRAVPLLSIIYWAWIVVPLVMPPTDYVADIVRGIAGFVFFYAAFVAEYVRSGLQSVPIGQREAAEALGMSSFDVNRMIVLPQAIRTVVPALVGNVLEIFNNVPLVFIIGLTDFLKAGQTVLANPQYSASQYEVYTFLFASYLLIGAFVSYTARRLETHLNVGIR